MTSTSKDVMDRQRAFPFRYYDEELPEGPEGVAFEAGLQLIETYTGLPRDEVRRHVKTVVRDPQVIRSSPSAPLASQLITPSPPGSATRPLPSTSTPASGAGASYRFTYLDIPSTRTSSLASSPARSFSTRAAVSDTHSASSPWAASPLRTWRALISTRALLT